MTKFRIIAANKKAVYGISFLACLAAASPAFGWTLTIVNNLDYKLSFNEIANRQDVEIKSNPPKIVLPRGGTGSFEVVQGDQTDKNVHLKVQYYLESENSQVTVEFGLDNGDCYAKSSGSEGEINSTYEHCESDTTEFIFGPK
jgi:hypothetical protein